MSQAIDAVVGKLTIVKQTAKGSTPDFTATTRPADTPKWIDGLLDPKKTLAEADYLDGRAFSSPTTYTKELSGEVGNLKIQAEPGNAGIHLAFILANDTVTGSSDPYTHTSTSDSTAAQPYLGVAQSVGAAIAPKRDYFADCLYGAMTITSNHDDQPLTFDTKINALKSGVVFTSTPAKAENGEDPYLHSESVGVTTIDGVVTCEVNEAVTTIDRKQTVYFGNDVNPCQIIPGKGAITTTFKTIATDATLTARNKVIYNDPAPSAAAVPVKDVYYMALNRKYVRSASRSLEIQHPRVAVNPGDIAVGPRLQGGAVEMTFGGACLRSGSTPAMTTIAKTGDSAAYV